MRKYWNNFITDTCVLVFVVDSTDNEKRLSLAFDELHKLLGDERLKKIPFVVVAAKQVLSLKLLILFLLAVLKNLETKTGTKIID